MKQTPPFALQVELVEGCTLACEFCGVNGIREKPGNFKFMSPATAVRLVQELKRLREWPEEWNPRIEFAMHGEPSVHPYLEAMVGTFRDGLGKRVSMVMFSNGSGFLRDPSLINRVLDAGINTIGLDAYEHVNIVPRVMEAYSKLETQYPIYKYPQMPDHNLHSGRRVGHKDIVVIKDITEAKAGNHSTLNTHCGAGLEPPSSPLQKRCAKPFRELSVRWDGNVAICCNDFRGEYKCGSIMDQPLDALWNNEAFYAARKKLMVPDRGFKPCDKCTATSMRVGLLPDHRGSVVLPAPNEYDDQIIAKATEGPAYSPIVRRKWETARPGETFNLVPDRTEKLKEVMKRR